MPAGWPLAIPPPLRSPPAEDEMHNPRIESIIRGIRNRWRGLFMLLCFAVFIAIVRFSPVDYSDYPYPVPVARLALMALILLAAWVGDSDWFRSDNSHRGSGDRPHGR